MFHKWIDHFEDVSAVMFITSIADFDRESALDGSLSRLNEKLSSFDQICNCKTFRDRSTPCILMLTQKDCFDEKIKTSKPGKVKDCFPEYAGSDRDPDSIMRFILGNFQKIVNIHNQDKLLCE